MGKHKLQGEKHSVKRSLFMVLGLLGPGLVAALADNDAGGVISYAVTGALTAPALVICYYLPYRQLHAYCSR